MKIQTRPGDLPRKELNDLVELQKSRAIRFNEEYQRAPAWRKPQKQLFIDSVLRGYSIPAFYLHKVAVKGKDLDGNETVTSQHYDVIDGQQRIRAVCEFVNDGFSLLRPSEFKLPPFLTETEVPWAGKKFSELSPELQNRFGSQPVVIYEMTTDSQNEIRDLFIRLQGGTPLSAQDKRDTYPGQLPEYVKKVAGKVPLNRDDIVHYHGHPFFNELVWGKEKTSRKRQLAAQLLLLLDENKPGEEISYHGINSPAIDDFYWRASGDFDAQGELAVRFNKIVDELYEILRNGTPPIKGHEAIHLCLLFNSLSEGYVDGWRENFLQAFQQFRQKCENSSKSKDGDHYMRYVRWIAQNAASADTIERRHTFFTQQMLSMLSPQAKDPHRIFSFAEKQQIYFRDRGHCQWCRMQGRTETVLWRKAEFHHVLPHSEGGATALDNGALLHSHCHRDIDAAKFLEWWEREGLRVPAPVMGMQKKRKISDLPAGTKCRFEYDEAEYQGQITNSKLDIPELGEFTSFKKASETIIGSGKSSTRNWWREWEIRLPGDDRWIPADDWQGKA